MNRKPFDRREQRVFLRTLVLASLAGCAVFTIVAAVRGDALATPLLASLSALLSTGVVFGWFGRVDEQRVDGR